MTPKDFSRLALSFPETETYPHFDRVAFKVKGRRIFATLLEREGAANIVLTVEEQKEFCRAGKENIFPVPNKWGEKGWTTFLLGNAAAEEVQAALTLAYEAVLNKSSIKKQNK